MLHVYPKAKSTTVHTLPLIPFHWLGQVKKELQYDITSWYLESVP